MELAQYSSDWNAYLAVSDVIDFENEEIRKLAAQLWEQSKGNLDYIRRAYEFVRDHISHSADIDEDRVTCAASQVLLEKHGICFAKSHLLAALLRVRGIPAGFCYQKLVLDDENDPSLVLHGLNGVYLEECGKWIRLDARGNRAGVDAQFSLEKEQLAYPVRPEWGEKDILVVYPEPDQNILKALRENSSRRELWEALPAALVIGMENS